MFKRNGRSLSDELQKAAKASDLIATKTAREAANAIENFIVDNFANERYGKTAKKWEKPKEKTKRGEIDRGGVLVRSGDLLRDVTNVEVFGTEVHFGSDLPYAQIQNEGSGFGKERKFMPEPGEKLPEELEQELDAYVDQLMDKLLG